MHVLMQAPTNVAVPSALNCTDGKEQYVDNSKKGKHIRTFCVVCYNYSIVYGAIRIHVKKAENSCLCLSKYKKPVCD